MNTVTASFNTSTGQMTEMSRRKKKTGPKRQNYATLFYFKHLPPRWRWSRRLRPFQRTFTQWKKRSKIISPPTDNPCYFFSTKERRPGQVNFVTTQTLR